MRSSHGRTRCSTPRSCSTNVPAGRSSRSSDGINEGLDWPQVILNVGADRLGSGIAMLAGPEPDLRWQSFADAVAELATALEVRLMVGFGGFPAAAPHTRPVKLAATASNSQLATKIGFIPGAIEVPSGIQGVIELACAKVGIPSVGLWARVPHYVAAMPFPAASVVLLDGLASLSGLVIDSHVLSDSADAARVKVDELIAQSSEHQEMVRQLEQQIDELEGDAGHARRPAGALGRRDRGGARAVPARPMRARDVPVGSR